MAVENLGSRKEKYDPSQVQDVRQWLEELLGESLPAGDLFAIIKDGTVICRAANAIEDRIAPFKKSNMPFVQMENIASFLRAAERIGVPHHELFETVDLYEQKDPVQVFITIRALSRYAHKKNPAIPVIGPKLVDPSRAKSPAKQVEIPAWNTRQYGYMGGASQGTEGVVFGSRRDITSPPQTKSPQNAPKILVPSGSQGSIASEREGSPAPARVSSSSMEPSETTVDTPSRSPISLNLSKAPSTRSSLGLQQPEPEPAPEPVETTPQRGESSPAGNFSLDSIERTPPTLSLSVGKARHTDVDPSPSASSSRLPSNAFDSPEQPARGPPSPVPAEDSPSPVRISLAKPVAPAAASPPPPPPPRSPLGSTGRRQPPPSPTPSSAPKTLSIDLSKVPSNAPKVPPKPSGLGRPAARPRGPRDPPSVFNDDSKPPARFGKHAASDHRQEVNAQLAAYNSSSSQGNVAEEFDESVYAYDEVYDTMKAASQTKPGGASASGQDDKRVRATHTSGARRPLEE